MVSIPAILGSGHSVCKSPLARHGEAEINRTILESMGSMLCIMLQYLNSYIRSSKEFLTSFSLSGTPFSLLLFCFCFSYQNQPKIFPPKPIDLEFAKCRFLRRNNRILRRKLPHVINQKFPVQTGLMLVLHTGESSPTVSDVVHRHVLVQLPASAPIMDGFL